MKSETYIFRIDRFTPETLPLERLVAYLKELADLFGNKERVHFKALRPGSAQLVNTVEREAAPKVRERLLLVKSDAPPKDVRTAYKHLNRLLQQDDAVASMKRGKTTVISFPGRRAASEKIGPFTQHTEITGLVVRVGGYDESAHALIEDAEHQITSVEMTRDQARELRSFLYEPTPVRIAGLGRWTRTASAEWQLVDMTLKSWEPLRSVSLIEAVTGLRTVESRWAQEGDPHKLLERIRNGDEEVH
jgi:hypothetical protein